jgi:hypothetical protein
MDFCCLAQQSSQIVEIARLRFKEPLFIQFLQFVYRCKNDYLESNLFDLHIMQQKARLCNAEISLVPHDKILSVSA